MSSFIFNFSLGEAFSNFYLLGVFKRILFPAALRGKGARKWVKKQTTSQRRLVLTAAGSAFGVGAVSEPTARELTALGGALAPALNHVVALLEKNIRRRKRDNGALRAVGISRADLALLAARRHAQLTALRSLEENYFNCKIFFPVSGADSGLVMCRAVGERNFVTGFSVRENERVLLKKAKLMVNLIRSALASNRFSATKLRALAARLINLMLELRRKPLPIANYLSELEPLKPRSGRYENLYMRRGCSDWFVGKRDKRFKLLAGEPGGVDVPFARGGIVISEFDGKNARAALAKKMTPLKRTPYIKIFDEIVEAIGRSGAYKTASK
jgi:hypothetical protein